MTAVRVLREHPLSPRMFHPDALAVVRAFRERGHLAYFTGGSVRDLVLRTYPKDFDIGTLATGDEIRAVLGGDADGQGQRRHRPVQTTVLRDDSVGIDVLPMSDPPWVPAEVWRRRARSGDVLRDFAESFDFTMNALLYDPIDDVLIDYVDGLSDLGGRRLRRVCGRGEDFTWDPVSILRGVVQACRLGLTIEPGTRASMAEHAAGLLGANPARLGSHLTKLLSSSVSARAIAELRAIGVIDTLFPPRIASGLADAEAVGACLRALDDLPKAGLPVAVLIAVLLSEPLRAALVGGATEAEPDALGARPDPEREETPDDRIEELLEAMDARFPMPKRIWSQTRWALLGILRGPRTVDVASLQALRVVGGSASEGASTGLLVGPEGLEGAILARIEGASEALRMMAYELDRDAIVGALAEARDRGVRVQVLLDGAQPENEATRLSLESAGVEIRLAPAGFPHAHAKVLLVDRSEALVLSANFTDYSMEAERNYAVVVRSPGALADLHVVFECDWGSGTFAGPSDPGLVVSPVNARQRVQALLEGAREHLSLEVMYLADDRLRQTLADRARAGVRVRVLLADPGWIDANVATAMELGGQGVEVRFLSDYDLHAKLVIADGAVLVGSMNLSPRSLDDNREIGMISTEVELHATALECFECDWDSAVPFEPARADVAEPEVVAGFAG